MSNPLKRLLLIGGGGHCRSVIDVIRLSGEFEVVGILDQQDKLGEFVDGIEIIGSDDDLSKKLDLVDECLVTVGQLDSGSLRQSLYEKVISLGGSMATVISPRAYVSPSAQVGKGTVVMHDSLINANANVGINCIINTKSLVEHDAKIDSHVHLATNSTINGHAHIEDSCFIGSCSVVFQECVVGKGSVVGGGQVVRRDLLQHSKPKDII